MGQSVHKKQELLWPKLRTKCRTQSAPDQMTSPSLSVELELVPPFSSQWGTVVAQDRKHGAAWPNWCNPGMTKEGVSPGPVQERLLRKGGELRAAHHEPSLQMHKGSEEDACHDDAVPSS